MMKPTEVDAAHWVEERDGLIQEATARPSATAHFQSAESIDSALAKIGRREHRIAELSQLISAHEADHAKGT